MKKFKALAALLLCIIIFTVSIPLTAAAGSLKITVSNLTAVPGDEIAVAVDISENTGVMAMTFALGYDTKVLTYNGFNIGIFNDYTVVDHPDRGYVSFVNCENADRTYEGNILVMKFTVNDDAPAGLSDLTVMNVRPEEYGESMDGCFANWNGDVITPTIVNGSVTVGETCTNSGHKYGDWKVVSVPLCETEGVNNRSCIRCGHTELKNVKAVGHDFEDKWTVDTPATEGESGKMSRHCKRCEKTTDEVSFALDVPQKNDFENKGGEQVRQEQWPVLETFEPTDNTPDTESSEPVESTDTDVPSNETEQDGEQNNDGTQETKPDTGLMVLLSVLLAVLVVIIVFIIIVIRRKNKE